MSRLRPDHKHRPVNHAGYGLHEEKRGGVWVPVWRIWRQSCRARTCGMQRARRETAAGMGPWGAWAPAGQAVPGSGP